MPTPLPDTHEVRSSTGECRLIGSMVTVHLAFSYRLGNNSAAKTLSYASTDTRITGHRLYLLAPSRLSIPFLSVKCAF